MSDIFKYIESEDFRDYVKNKVIEYNEINGYKSVKPEFILDTLKIDPISISEKMLDSNEFNENEKDNIKLGFSILNIKIKKIIQEEIAKASFDVTSDSSFNDYVDCIIRLGFKEIYSKEHLKKENGNFSNIEDMYSFLDKKGVFIIQDSIKIDEKNRVNVNYNIKEYEKIFFHPEHNFLIQIDSYFNDRVNHSILYTNVEKKDKKHFTELMLSQSYIQYTDTLEVSLDLRDLPSQKIETLLTDFNTVDYLKSFNFSLRSYLSNDEGINKINSFNKETKDKLFSKNVVYPKFSQSHKFIEENKDLFENLNNITNFLKNLDIEDYKESFIKNYLLDIKYEGYKFESIFTKKIKEKAVKENINLEFLYKCGAEYENLFQNTISYDELKEEDFIKAVKNFNEEESKVFVNNVSTYLLKDKNIKKAHEFAENKIKNKIKKNKLN